MEADGVDATDEVTCAAATLACATVVSVGERAGTGGAPEAGRDVRSGGGGAA